MATSSVILLKYQFSSHFDVNVQFNLTCLSARHEWQNYRRNSGNALDMYIVLNVASEMGKGANTTCNFLFYFMLISVPKQHKVYAQFPLLFSMWMSLLQLQRVSHGSGGRAGRSNQKVVRSPAPPVRKSKCPWARHWTPNCSWWLSQQPSTCVWMSECRQCKALWIKALYKCSPFTICCFQCHYLTYKSFNGSKCQKGQCNKGDLACGWEQSH